MASPQLLRHSHVIRNVLAFCRLLKTVKVDVSMNKVLDACRSLEFIDIGKREDLYWVLRASLVSRQQDLAPFDAVFHFFWAQPQEPPKEDESLCGPEGGEEGSGVKSQEAGEEKEIFLEDFAKSGSSQEEPHPISLLQYSPHETLAEKDFCELTDDEVRAMRQLIQQLAPKISTVLSRRRAPDPRGDVVDPSRTWRRNLRYGGDVVELARKKRRLQKTKVILLCDVSGSMDCYSRFIIQFLYAMQHELRNMETFVFSTRLTRITHLLRRRGVRDALEHVAKIVKDWSGGTMIGSCLSAFSESWGRFALQRKTVVVIVSDGWDRGDAGQLSEQMERLHRKAAKVIWLNPLLGSPSYRPLCKGMQAALPHIDHFLPAHNLNSLVDLVRALRYD